MSNDYQRDIEKIEKKIQKVEEAVENWRAHSEERMNDLNVKMVRLEAHTVSTEEFKGVVANINEWRIENKVLAERVSKHFGIHSKIVNVLLTVASGLALASVLKFFGL